MIRFNHKVRVYRETEGEDAYGSTSVLEPGAEPAADNGRPDQAWSGDQQEAGGEMQGAKRRWFLHPATDVRERDVLSVTSGPEAPSTLRVVSAIPVGNGRTTHHIEANVETYTGEIITEVES